MSGPVRGVSSHQARRQRDLAAASGPVRRAAGVLLALANYYGDSSLFAFDPGHLPRRAGKKPTAREVQRVSTSAAHDWEALRLPDGTEQLVVANSEATYSVVLQRNDTRLRHALPPPRCSGAL